MGGGRKDGPRVIHLTGSLIWLLREQFSCCGYFLLNETTIETVGFCADPNNVNRFNPNNTKSSKKNVGGSTPEGCVC